MSIEQMTTSERLRRLLAALDDLDLRARRAAEFLGEVPAEEAVRALDELLRSAQRRLDPDAVALQGHIRGLDSYVPPPLADRLREAAEEAGAHSVQALFSKSVARREFDHDREKWVDREMRALTLGERKAMARGRNADVLSRLAQDHDPAVVRNLLENPRCTEREALLAASRRPARAVVLQEVFRSRKWGVNRRVRKALAQNPYSPPALAVQALSLLAAQDLREISADGTLASEVRVQARLLLAQRKGEG
ncbi:MAG: hypothetical protein ACJ78W_17135 [Myxococcales bacterium]